MASYTKAIRLKCLDCCGGVASEVRRCTAISCPLWGYRFGKSPEAAKRSHPEYMDKRAMLRTANDEEGDGHDG